METNELPEDVKAKIMDYAKACSYGGMYNPASFEGAEFGYRLALQSKEGEINRISENFASLQVRLGEECTKSNALEEQLKAKDEQIKGLINRRVGHTVLDGLYEEQKSTIDSLSSEVARLKEALIKVQSLLSQSTDKQDKP